MSSSEVPDSSFFVTAIAPEPASMAVLLLVLLTTALFFHTMALSPVQSSSSLLSTSTSTSSASTTTSLSAAAASSSPLFSTPSASPLSIVGAAKRREIPPGTKQIHLCILIHGWLGGPLEMFSIQQALELKVNRAKGIPIEGLDNNNNNNNSNDDSDVSEVNSITEDVPVQDPITIPDGTCVIVYSTECNSGKGMTTDGVDAGGSRVAMEVNDLIRELFKSDDDDTNIIGENNGSRTKDYDMSISIIGNSLGGLYARAAIAEIDWHLPNGKTLQPNVFCTTATPHLGKRGQTYIKLPRFAETGIGLALQPTGQDLFGLNTVIENLATKSKYIDPLKKFRKRIAYANAFGTDLQVPTATAAFLADTESPHYTQESKPPFMLTVTTPRDEGVLKSIAMATASSPEEDERQSSSPSTPQHVPASTMARTLDALGWTKVFCDVRDKLVSVPVPFKEETSSEFKVKETWSSHELKTQVASRVILDKKWSIPFGHTMLIANSKSEFYAKLNSGGMPFVDQLTTEFLEDVLDCSMTS